MWIKTIVLVGCVLATLGSEEQRSNNKKKEDPRGKRNLQYLAHHYNGPHSYLERRISTGSQIPSLYHSQFFPGPRSYSPYHKGRPHSLYPPPYAVQMEPLVHYSQRDPLYDTNTLSLNADGQDDLLTDNNHLSENVYGPQKHVVERPVYIKEPEPIIEIIIKESNVTLPPPPAPPTPPPKKKEQVQVFYVKYKKNPNGHGKESVIYDKPIPAISQPVPEEHEEPQPYHHHHQEVVTSPPPPSTTLRTIIRPDSETYHSPSGVKVTFGKESFDYDKRSSKPEDLKASPGDHRSIQFPQGRQLSSFPPSVPRRPSNHNFNPSTNSRQPQPYRPFNFFRQQTQNFRPNPQQYSTLPKFPEFSQPPKTSQRFPPPRPVPPQFQRQPVPYQPFEALRTQPPIQFRPQTHFPVTQSPITEKPHFNQFRQQFNQAKPPSSQYHTLPQFQQENNFPQRPEPQFQQPQQRPEPQFQQPQQRPEHFQQPQFQQPSIIPPGGELIQSLPKFEQHISVSEPSPSQFQYQPQSKKQEPQQQFQYQPQPKQPEPQQQFQYQTQPKPQEPQQQFQYQQKTKQPEFQYQQQPKQEFQYQQQPKQEFKYQQQQSSVQVEKPKQHQHSPDQLQQQLREANAFQESIRHSSPQFFNFQQPQYYQTSPKPTTPRPTTSTTTQEPEKPSTTTKDPKVLNAQLPDEVPDDLRQQLLSSGILNNADISVLDYDKVGDIPLSALPPDQLANFYSAGGAQQIAAGSEPVPAVADRQFEAEASEIHEVTAKPEVQMKVVRYDPESDRGQQVQEAYVKNDATQVEPVVLNDEKYNRYLPLKVSGAQFPIPDVPELKGKKISSVVVLAPVKYDFASSRQTRDAKEVELVEGQFLKELLEDPSTENFKRFLENENRTRSDRQAVILLVTGPNEAKEREIFMYDLATQTVSKLNGELSSAFVNAAEANSLKDTKASASEIVETRVPVIDPQSDLETEASENLESFVDVSGIPVDDDLTASETRHSKTGV
ncbi:bromodomain-containing protein 4 isoform X2 [Tribolium castaneum]|uniref:bromodomain-containing protein 4 isoform X2 n=1 Tax=Tribolium castaneum TaxID=7070 RepID=UPI0030FE8E98